MDSIKKILKSLIPQPILNKRAKQKKHRYFVRTYMQDLARYLQYSDLSENDSEIILISRITRRYHSIEKGLTMPVLNLGFGKEAMLELTDTCKQYIKKFGTRHDQLQHALSVISEYWELHQCRQFELDIEIVHAIQSLFKIADQVAPTKQKTITKEEYFKNVGGDFKTFSNSRSSVRNYSDEPVPIEKIVEAVSLAINAPSACNRQTFRVYAYTNPTQVQEILTAQAGNRGFGHLVSNLIIVTADLGVFTGIGERNQAFVDGGIFVMNLLYALQYNRLVTCLLNCSVSMEKDKKLRKLCNIKESEVFITMISCGYPVDEFQVCISKRYPAEDILRIVS